MSAKIALALSLAMTYAGFALANGGDQRIVENKYFINLSRAPFTPRAGEKVEMLASFFDIQANRLVAEDLTVRARIAKLGGEGSTKRTFLFEQDNIRVEGGVLELPYTFGEAGLHEVFFDFALASDPQKTYEAPDFLLDVQKPASKNTKPLLAIGMGVGGIILGFALGWLLKRPIRLKNETYLRYP